MSKLNDNKIDGIEEVVDDYKEHQFHTEVDEHCSECYKVEKED